MVYQGIFGAGNMLFWKDVAACVSDGVSLGSLGGTVFAAFGGIVPKTSAAKLYDSGGLSRKRRMNPDEPG